MAKDAEVNFDKNTVKELNKMLLKLPNYLDREKALLMTERKAAKVMLHLYDKYTGSPGLFQNVDTQSAPSSGRNYINNLNSTVQMSTIKTAGAPGVRVGLKARKGSYVSYHANFLEDGTALRQKKSGASTGALKSYKLQETVWSEGLKKAQNVLKKSLAGIVDKVWDKKYNGK